MSKTYKLHAASSKGRFGINFLHTVLWSACCVVVKFNPGLRLIISPSQATQRTQRERVS